MGINQSRIKIPSLILTLIPLFLACREYDNFTTYYNTYYNAERLIEEAEEEFEFQDEKKRTDPRVVTPNPKLEFEPSATAGAPPFLASIIIDQQKLQPVQTKVDSVIVKCSKILAKHPKSDYVDKSLFLIAKAYFYRREWLPAQIKCSELIDKFPDGSVTPDAYLLLAKTLLIQKKIHSGKNALSKTVDLAWAKKRYDILSETFKVQAELALYENDPDGALKPYRQAVAQTEDEAMKARWQTDLGLLLYRLHRFGDAADALKKVHEFSPDYVTEFEAYMYRAQSFTRLGRFSESEKILAMLEADGNNQDWAPWMHAVKMDLSRFKKEEKQFTANEKTADSAYASSPAIQTVYFECGMDYFFKPDFVQARKYLSRTKTLRTPIFVTADKLYFLLSRFEEKNTGVQNTLKKLETGEKLKDSVLAKAATDMFDMGRILEQLQMVDSARFYYKKSAEVSPAGNPISARFIYAYSRSLTTADPIASDSLMEILVAKYPKTEYGKEAIIRQGYTKEYLIDTVAELFNSGKALIKAGEYPFGIERFNKLFLTYPKSHFAPKALYNAGWHFEKTVKILDSAIFYYQILMKNYPESEYAKDVRVPTEALVAKREGREYIDSVELRRKIARDSAVKADSLEKERKRLVEQELKKSKTPVKPSDRMKKNPNPMDMLKSAGEALDSAKSMIKDPSKIIEKANEALKDTNTVNIKPGIKHNIPTSMEQLLNSKDTTAKNGEKSPGGDSPPPDTTKSPGTTSHLDLSDPPDLILRKTPGGAYCSAYAILTNHKTYIYNGKKRNIG